MNSNLQENPENICLVNDTEPISKKDEYLLRIETNKKGNDKIGIPNKLVNSENSRPKVQSLKGNYNREGIENIIVMDKKSSITEKSNLNLNNSSNLIKDIIKKSINTDIKSQIRILLRFNCGKCQNKFSKIITPSIFARKCTKCKNPSDLVVLRCNDHYLIGGFDCSSCDNQFLDKLGIFEFNSVTPFCFECKKLTKLYQALLNRSKISIRNERVYYCLTCGKFKSISFYQPLKSLSNTTCCNNVMEFICFNRRFTYYNLDENGRSKAYCDNNNITNSFDLESLFKKECSSSLYKNYKYDSTIDNLPKLISINKKH